MQLMTDAQEGQDRLRIEVVPSVTLACSGPLESYSTSTFARW